jgi:plastocyanin
MRKLILVLALVAALAATAGGSLAATHRHTGGVVVKTYMNMKMVPNRYFQEGMRFAPGTVHVKSGETLTFEYGDKEDEPHTLTIVKRSDLPRDAMSAENCEACQRYATPHLQNPKAEPGPENPIVHWTLNKGKPGLDTVGDSIAIQPGAHKRISIKVTAAPGTTLYFLCAVHPWMLGKIVVG